MKSAGEENKQKAIELLAELNVKDYEITETHYGNSLNFGALKTIIVRNRYICDPSAFNKIGYGIINRAE